MSKRFAIFLAAGIGLGMLASQSWAQTFPTQPVRIISPFPAGSGPDVIARIVGEKLSATWKQPIIVDPRPGGNGFIAANAVKQAAPTGYDLLMADVGNLSIAPSLFKKLPYDPKADFVPIGLLYRTAFFVAVGANSPYQSVKDLVAAAAASPGKLSYGSNGVGSPIHLSSANLGTATGTKMLHVPYKELSQLYAAVSTGEVDWALGSAATAGPLLKAGKLRFIAVADNVRTPSLPNVPTLEESGGPKEVFGRTWVSLVAPKGTPAAVIATLNKGLNDVLRQPEVIEKLATFGFVPDTITPAALASLIESERVTYADLIKVTGASAE